MQYLTKAVTKMRKSKSLWTLKFRHRSSTGDHSTSVIVLEYPHTDAPFPGIIETNQVGGAFVREKLVAKCYLCAKTAGPLTLEYYLLVSPLVEELEIYGVKIVEKRSGVVAIAPGLTTSGRKILHLIDLLSKGTVTPTSLADIVEDWL